MSQPTTLLLDFKGWKRALNPAVRVVGYTAAIYVIVTMVTLVPLFIFGAPVEVYTFFTYLNTLIFFFGVIVSIFKVMDEEKARPITEISGDSIKLM